MPKKLLYFTSALGLVAILALVALGVIVYGGILTPEKLRRVIKYNPLATRTLPVVTESAIQTTFFRLKRRDIALSAMGAGLVNGGGAFVETENGLLVAERGGRFFFLDETGGKPRLRLTDIAVDINQDGFDRDAEAAGYALKPGRNVGYAGLAMRLHDLLLLSDGKRLMASHTRWDDENTCASLHFAIADIDQSADPPTAAPWRELYRTQPCLGFGPRKSKPFAGHQAGGRMIELDDGKVLFTVGDFKNDGEKRDVSTADLDVDYGKMHLLDPDTGAVQRNYTTGHRNPQGLVLLENGEIWSTEHGPSGGDEVNKIVAGNDYGWPKVTLGRDCNGCEWQIEGRHDGFVKPRWSFHPSIGISNLIELRNFIPLWEGDLLIASLYGETLYRIRLDGDRPIYAAPLPIGERLRDITQLEDGRIAIWTDTGKFVFLTPDLAPSPAEKLLAEAPEEVAEAVRDCAVCHELDPGAPRPGRLTLWGVVGRDKAGWPGFAYSEALEDAGGQWTTEALDRFLESPETAIPGTSMAYDGLADAELRRGVIEFLQKLQHEG